MEKAVSSWKISSLIPAVSIAAIPLVEFAALRIFFHSGLGLKIGYMGMTDYDWVFPTVLSFLLFMLCIERTQKIELKFNRTAALVNVVLLLAFCLVSTQYTTLFAKFGSLFKGTWILFAFTTLFSACFYWVKPAQFLKHPDRRLLLPFVLLASCKLISRHLFSFLWQPVLGFTGQHVYKLLKLVFVNVNYKPFITATGERFMHVSHPIYTVAIGSGCSGMEGISFGLFALLISAFFEFRRFNAFQWLMLAVGMAAWMYLLNVLRIVVFFMISLMALSSWGHDSGIRTAMTLFHNSVGWILYTGGLFLYYKFIYSSVFARLTNPKAFGEQLAAKASR